MNDEAVHQCGNCRQHDIGSFVAKTGIARSTQAVEFLQRDHVVYLALFGRHATPKVGVAQRQRFSDRIHEQGAWAAIDILQTDGSKARAIERQINTEMRLPETMNIEKKLKQIGDALDEETARSILEQTIEDIRHRLTSIPARAEQFIFTRPDFDITEHAIDDAVYLIKPIELDFRLSGQIVGILGKVALILSVDKVYALNTKLLEGYEIEMSVSEDGITGADSYGLHTKKVPIDKQERLF